MKRSASPSSEQYGTIRKKIHTNQINEPGSLQQYIKNPKTIRTLQKRSVERLFPIQFETFNLLIQGEDLIGRDRTGSGKTLAYALPIIERCREFQLFKNGLVKFMIILPTRQLALQVKNEIQTLKYEDEPDFRIMAVYGKSDINKQIEDIKNGLDIIVGTPGRILDLLEKDVIKMNELQVLCLDQADEMLKQGFKEEIAKIYKYVENNAPGKTQNLLFSATIPEWLREIANYYLSIDTKYINLVDDNFSPSTLQHYCLEMSEQDLDEKGKLVGNLIKKFSVNSGKTIIFCERKLDVEDLSKQLSVRCEGLHGDVPQARRESTYRKFKLGDLTCLIATNVAARGLDFPEVDLVIQMEPPRAPEDYIHRSGRTARVGRNGVCVTLYTNRAYRNIKNIEEHAKISMIKLQAKDFAFEKNERRGNEENGYNGSNEKSYRNRDNCNGNNNNNSSGNNHYNGNGNNDNFDSQPKYKSVPELMIKSLPTSENEESIKEFFISQGVEITTFKLLKTPDGESKGLGFAKFRNQADRDRCLLLNGTDFLGYSLQITLPKPRDSPNTNQDTNKNTSSHNSYQDKPTFKVVPELFIQSLPSSAEANQVKQFFLQRGIELTGFRLLKTPDGDSKGMGFAKFNSDDDRDKGLQLNGQQLDGYSLQISKPKEKKGENNRNNDRNNDGNNYRNNDSNNDRNGYQRQTYNDEPRQQFKRGPELYVQGLPKSTEEFDIKQWFMEKGINLSGLKLLKTPEGESKGCGFLKFSCEEDRDKCLDLNSEQMEGNKLRISTPRAK